ncbi:hypothetical protein Taro_017116, partial [Colocasia esculenta]|nr:hypothetical protein [Colocasia esculenta]
LEHQFRCYIDFVATSTSYETTTSFLQRLHLNINFSRTLTSCETTISFPQRFHLNIDFVQQRLQLNNDFVQNINFITFIHELCSHRLCFNMNYILTWIMIISSISYQHRLSLYIDCLQTSTLF